MQRAVNPRIQKISYAHTVHIQYKSQIHIDSANCNSPHAMSSQSQVHVFIYKYFFFQLVIGSLHLPYL